MRRTVECQLNAFNNAVELVNSFCVTEAKNIEAQLTKVLLSLHITFFHSWFAVGVCINLDEEPFLYTEKA